ncbi:hypothetical protein K3495_g15023 [Podosphaera aphanis]|nr:hypothetical protein K3495_g15023 [Podosphaera aphanis]
MSKVQVIVPRNDKLRDMISQSSQRSSSRISETPEIDNTVSLGGPPSTHSIEDDIYMEDDEDEDELTERITSPTSHTETIGYNEWVSRTDCIMPRRFWEMIASGYVKL